MRIRRLIRHRAPLRRLGFGRPAAIDRVESTALFHRPLALAFRRARAHAPPQAQPTIRSADGKTVVLSPRLAITLHLYESFFGERGGETAGDRSIRTVHERPSEQCRQGSDGRSTADTRLASFRGRLARSLNVAGQQAAHRQGRREPADQRHAETRLANARLRLEQGSVASKTSAGTYASPVRRPSHSVDGPVPAGDGRTFRRHRAAESRTGEAANPAPVRRRFLQFIPRGTAPFLRSGVAGERRQARSAAHALRHRDSVTVSLDLRRRNPSSAATTEAAAASATAIASRQRPPLRLATPATAADNLASTVPVVRAVTAAALSYRSGSASASTSMAAAPPPAPVTRPAPQPVIDTDRLARDVWRKLEQRVRIERERRGRL